MKLFPWQKRKRVKPKMEWDLPVDQDTPLPSVQRDELGYRAASLQGQGKRERQEDSYLLKNHQDVILCREKGFLAIVADGMGGMKGGKLASETGIKCLSDAYEKDAPLEEPAQWLEQHILQANHQVIRLLDGKGGSTAVCCVIYREKLWFASVGDSFLYLFRNGELSRLNRLQTVLHREYQKEIRGGNMDPALAKQHRDAAAITGFLGMKNLSDVDLLLAPLPLKAEDTLLLCSDGVGGVLEESDIIYCMNQGKAEEVCEALRQRVLSKCKPYQDNFTALVIQCVR